jgi:hypothetical protein
MTQEEYLKELKLLEHLVDRSILNEKWHSKRPRHQDIAAATVSLEVLSLMEKLECPQKGRERSRPRFKIP